jgi:hypothetical protein
LCHQFSPSLRSVTGFRLQFERLETQPPYPLDENPEIQEVLRVEISDFQSQTFRCDSSAAFLRLPLLNPAQVEPLGDCPDSFTPHQAYGYLIGQESNLLLSVLHVGVVTIFTSSTVIVRLAAPEPTR